MAYALTTVTQSLSFLASERDGLASTPSHMYPEGASKTFKKRSPVILTAGLVAEAASNASGSLVGLVMQDGANLATLAPQDRIEPFLPNVTFEGILTDTSGSAARATVAADLGATVGFVKDSTSLGWYLDIAGAANKVAVVIGFKDPVGTLDGRVFFKVLVSKTIFG